MKKFFGALFVALIIFSANVHAAKPALLADLNAETFFANLGYEVDCSYWERMRDGRQQFNVILPETPLAMIKDEPNMEVYSEGRKGKVVEVVIYFKTTADKNSVDEFLAKVLNALDENFFQANSDAIKQSLEEFTSTQEEKIIADKYVMSRETSDEKIFIVHVTPAQNS